MRERCVSEAWMPPEDEAEGRAHSRVKLSFSKSTTNVYFFAAWSAEFIFPQGHVKRLEKEDENE